MPKPLVMAVIAAALLTLVFMLSPQAKAEPFVNKPWRAYLIAKAADHYIFGTSEPYASKTLCEEARTAEVARLTESGAKVLRSRCIAAGSAA